MKEKVLALTYRITPDGLVEYSVQIPSHRARSPSGQKYGADIEWILAGKNSSVLYQGCSLAEYTIKYLTVIWQAGLYFRQGGESILWVDHH